MSRKYKCIKKYPSGPPVGTIAIFREEYTDYWLFNSYYAPLPYQYVEDYPEFWAKYIFTTEDKIDIFKGDKYYEVYKLNPNKIKESIAVIGDELVNDWKTFRTREKAQKYLDSLKPKFEVEIWYGVKLSDYSTFIVNSKEVVSIEPFRLFDTKEERNKYIRLNKPKHSLQDIKKFI